MSGKNGRENRRNKEAERGMNKEEKTGKINSGNVCVRNRRERERERDDGERQWWKSE